VIEPSGHGLSPTLRRYLIGDTSVIPRRGSTFVIGVLEGEGIGPDVVGVALEVLSAVQSVSDVRFDVRPSESYGIDPVCGYEVPLAPEVRHLCEEAFAAGGAVLAGPGGGRFVYDLRAELDLFCKLVPVKPVRELRDVGRLRPEAVDRVDVVIIRENVSGIYFGRYEEEVRPDEGRHVDYTFSYTEREVTRILEVGARMACDRRQGLLVVTKEGAFPGIADLWRDCAHEVGSRFGLTPQVEHIDYASYCLVQHPRELDVVVTSNLFGDVLADISAVLLGSRGNSFSGNFSPLGGVYQTNHGAAQALVGKDEANPVGQVLTAAMMLRDSFALEGEADLIERAVADVWRQGWRTRDLVNAAVASPKPEHIIGTREMGVRIAESVVRLAHARART